MGTNPSLLLWPPAWIGRGLTRSPNGPIDPVFGQLPFKRRQFHAMPMASSRPLVLSWFSAALPAPIADTNVVSVSASNTGDSHLTFASKARFGREVLEHLGNVFLQFLLVLLYLPG